MLYLVRHGQTDWIVEPACCQGWMDVPLHQTGRLQTHAQARELAGGRVVRVASSCKSDAVRDAAGGPLNALLATHSDGGRLARALFSEEGVESFHHISVINGYVVTPACAGLAARPGVFPASHGAALS